MYLQSTKPGLAASLIANNIEDRLRVAAEMLIAGVAFQTSSTRWSVYSHNGEEIGELSTFIVNETTRVMKKLGFKRERVTDITREYDSVTFGHNCSHVISAEEMDRIIERRERKMSIIH